jgi:hypothetical protein
MTLRSALTGLLCASLLVSPLATGAPRPAKIAVQAATAPDGTDARIKRALGDAVAQHAAASGLAKTLQGYSLSPALVQLRRYTEPGQKQAKVVCIVSVALKDPRDNLLAEVRGSASASGAGASPLGALDAAAQAAVMRVPAALAKLRGESGAQIAQR